jgi:hypothetical protein
MLPNYVQGLADLLRLRTDQDQVAAAPEKAPRGLNLGSPEACLHQAIQQSVGIPILDDGRNQLHTSSSCSSSTIYVNGAVSITYANSEASITYANSEASITYATGEASITHTNSEALDERMPRHDPRGRISAHANTYMISVNAQNGKWG